MKVSLEKSEPGLMCHTDVDIHLSASNAEGILVKSKWKQVQDHRTHEALASAVIKYSEGNIHRH